MENQQKKLYIFNYDKGSRMKNWQLWQNLQKHRQLAKYLLQNYVCVESPSSQYNNWVFFLFLICSKGQISLEKSHFNQITYAFLFW